MAAPPSSGGGKTDQVLEPMTPAEVAEKQGQYGFVIMHVLSPMELRGAAIMVNPSGATIGSRNATFVLQDKMMSISRLHCVVKLVNTSQGPMYTITDLGSSNGTYLVQGQSVLQLQPHNLYPLKVGLFFRLGLGLMVQVSHVGLPQPSMLGGGPDDNAGIANQAVPAMETPLAASPSETGNGTPPNLFGTPPAVSDAGSSSGGVGMSSSGPPGSINVEELYGEMGSVASVPEEAMPSIEDELNDVLGSVFGGAGSPLDFSSPGGTGGGAASTALLGSSAPARSPSSVAARLGLDQPPPTMDSAEFSFNMDDFLALADEATLGSVTESAALEPAPALGSGDGLSLLGSVGGVSVGSDGQSGSGTGSALGSITGGTDSANPPQTSASVASVAAPAAASARLTAVPETKRKRKVKAYFYNDGERVACRVQPGAHADAAELITEIRNLLGLGDEVGDLSLTYITATGGDTETSVSTAEDYVGLVSDAKSVYVRLSLDVSGRRGRVASQVAATDESAGPATPAFSRTVSVGGPPKPKIRAKPVVALPKISDSQRNAVATAMKKFSGTRSQTLAARPGRGKKRAAVRKFPPKPKAKPKRSYRPSE